MQKEVMESATESIFVTGLNRDVFFSIMGLASRGHAGEVPQVPAKGIVTMVDLGADQCIPCKMIVPAMKKVEAAYEGKAAVTFIDVCKHDEQEKRLRIRAIPTQIFYDKPGKEVYRHVRFMNESTIV